MGKATQPAETQSYFYSAASGKSVSVTERQQGWTFHEWAEWQRYETVFQTNDPPAWPLSTVSGTKKLHVSKGVQITQNKTTVDVPDDAARAFKQSAKIFKDNCMTQGLKLGRSTAFITAVMCEMLRAYTVKSVKPFYAVFFRNRFMHVACLFSFVCTVLLTVIPGVKDIFQLDHPAWFFYLLAFVFAFGCMMNDELAKFFYRRELGLRKERRRRGMQQEEIKGRVEVLVEMLHTVTQGVDKADSDMFDVKEALGKVTRDVQEMKSSHGGRNSLSASI